MSKVKDGREYEELIDGVIDFSPADPDCSVNTFLLSKRTVVTATGTATLTAAQVVAGILDGTPVAAATYTFPTAALLVAGLKNPKVGSSWIIVINNKDAATYTITVAAGTGGTADGTLTIAPSVARPYVITLTNVTLGSEAYRLDGLG